MAAFITEGNRVIPASLTAITNGDASAPLIFPINHGWLYGTNKPLVANETRQNIVISLSTCLVAFGNVSLWFAVSAEVRPTHLVPENEIVVVTKTEEKPWKPFLNAQIHAKIYLQYIFSLIQYHQHLFWYTEYRNQ